MPEIEFTFLIDGVRRDLNDINVKNSDEDWIKSIQEFILEWNAGKSSFKVQTSGSTGKPKVFSVKRADLILSARLSIEHFNLRKGDTVLHCLPMNFIAGKLLLIRCLVGELNCIFIKPSSNPLEKLDYRVDFTAITPFQIHNVLKDESSANKLSQIDQIIIGGGDLQSSDKKRLKEYKNNIYQTYGMTETLTHIATKRISEEYFKLISDKFQVSLDQRGCLSIKTPYEHSKNLITNDIVEIKRQSFKWLGRIDNVINSGGIKLQPEEIEKKIEHLIDANYFIAGMPDNELGETLYLFIEGNMQEEKSMALLEEVKKIVGKYEVPKRIIYMDSFVYTESNKISRKVSKNKA